MNGRKDRGSARKVLTMLCGVWGSAIKKTLAHPKADEDARRIFRDKLKTYEESGRIIVYIDESGFAHDMPRLVKDVTAHKTGTRKDEPMPSGLCCTNACSQSDYFRPM